MTYNYKNGITHIVNFDKQPPFSSFLPGISGIHGIPLWAFYVNRAQAIASFGIDDKDHAIMEFCPSVITYENIYSKGFRTFIKTSSGFFEAFCEHSKDDNSTERNMFISENSLEIEEINNIFGIKINVKYYMLPQSNIGALVREVTFQNISNKTTNLEILDGMTRVLPFGIPNSEFKEMANLLRSFTQVSFQDSGIAKFASRATVDDSEEVEAIAGSYFYGTLHNNQTIKPICDINLVFGESTGLSIPKKFYNTDLSDLIRLPQYCDNKIPCAYTPLEIQLKANNKEMFTTMIGYTTEDVILADFKDKTSNVADELVIHLTSDIETHTSHPIFDGYLKQCYLDNLLRGGYPVSVGDNFEIQKVIHLYSRKHGDLERDYNFFKTESVHYSQGNGNFRDVCQNRRDSILFHPQLDDFDIRTFINLIQIDGYNPLEILPTKFRLLNNKSLEAEAYLEQKLKMCQSHTTYISKSINTINVSLEASRIEECKTRIIQALKVGVTPGDLYKVIKAFCPQLLVFEKESIEYLLTCCESLQMANHKEGFWIDHWTYIPHLIDSYSEIFPDRLHQLYFEKNNFKFFDGPAFVQPRKLKYGLKNGKVVQFGATIVDTLKKNRLENTYWVKDENGNTVYTTLFVKLLHLAIIKCATLDPFQMGIEMEAGKPGWNDAFNGLSGQLGSSVSETHDLLSLISRLLKVLHFAPKLIEIPKQIFEFFNVLSEYCLSKTQESISEFEFWNYTSNMREKWREDTRLYLESNILSITREAILEKLEVMYMLVQEGIKRAQSYGEIIPTYFKYDVLEFMLCTDCDGNISITPYGLQAVKPLAFGVKVLPLFLEAPAKQMSQLPKSLAHALHKRILKSRLYDNKLKMFKISEGLEELDISYGRICSFTPGWFERESIFLHMSYKYLLALLESEQIETFFNALKTSCIPFLSPEVYGRSPLENSSFIASSVNPDTSIHGRGYIARLSGSTAEMITLWKRIFLGNKLFEMDEGVLKFTFAPNIPNWLFDKNGSAYTTLLGCKVHYINILGKDTFGSNGVKIREIRVDGKLASHDCTLKGDLVNHMRNKELKNIEVYFGD